jgi:hypothetical protein
MCCALTEEYVQRCAAHLMAPSDQLHVFESVRRRMERCFQESFSEHVELHMYGSSAAELATAASDVDLSVSNPHFARLFGAISGCDEQRKDAQKRQKRAIVSTVAACLQRAGYVGIVQVAHARVPVVKLIDPRAGSSWTADGSVSCDVCINNVIGVANSALLREYACCDERCRKLMFLVKARLAVLAQSAMATECATGRGFRGSGSDCVARAMPLGWVGWVWVAVWAVQHTFVPGVGST